jgi:homocysteine S-methyltransferase
MAKYRSDLPQVSGELFLTDSGMETTLIFHKGLELPGFAAFTPESYPHFIWLR